jgi:RHS repeat-associated protein
MTQAETGKTFMYDAWNRLVKVKSGSTVLETFAYDGTNRRVTNTVGSTTTDLYYSDQWQVLEEKVGSSTSARYVWSPVYVDAMVLRDRDTDADGALDERLWAQQDANWNVTAVVDGTGAVVERYVYDAFGAVTVYSPTYSTVRSSSNYGWQYEFQGLQSDGVTGNLYARNRDYDPGLGRFTSLDPSRFEGGDSDLYRTMANSPINRTDSHGLLAARPSTLSIIHANRTGPMLHNYGFFAWPVNFELDEPADPNVGGLIIQRVERSTTLTAGTDNNLKSYHYVEVFEVPRGKRSPAVTLLKDAPPNSPAGSLRTQLMNRGFKLNEFDVGATDWFADRSHPDNTAGTTTFKGTIYYVDGISLKDLPVWWQEGRVEQAGNLPAFNVADTEKTDWYGMMMGVRAVKDGRNGDKTVIGPFIHSITVMWDANKGPVRSKVVEQIPK